jgi:hypothetical protein
MVNAAELNIAPAPSYTSARDRHLPLFDQRCFEPSLQLVLWTRAESCCAVADQLHPQTTAQYGGYTRNYSGLEHRRCSRLHRTVHKRRSRYV